MNTIVYLIRHSTKIDKNLMDNRLNNEHYQKRREKVPISVKGEKKAEKLSKAKEFENLDIIYSSNYSRAIQTAKYFSESQNLKINIDEGFNERKFGKSMNNIDIYMEQFKDLNLKNNEGESGNEVTERMYEAFMRAVDLNKGKRIAIFSHGAAITFLLMKWCNLVYIKEDKHKCLKFKNKIIVDKKFDTPEVFKITINENGEISDIQNIEFELGD